MPRPTPGGVNRFGSADMLLVWASQVNNFTAYYRWHRSQTACKYNDTLTWGNLQQPWQVRWQSQRWSSQGEV